MKENPTDDTIIVTCCHRLLFRCCSSFCLRIGTVAADAVAQLEDIEERTMLLMGSACLTSQRHHEHRN